MMLDDLEVIDLFRLCDEYAGNCSECPLNGECPIQDETEDDEDEE